MVYTDDGTFVNQLMILIGNKANGNNSNGIQNATSQPMPAVCHPASVCSNPFKMRQHML